jgi:hypothetical protein
MKIFMLILAAILLSGCATKYIASRTDGEGVETNLSVTTYREFQGGIQIVYNRTTGQFELQAGEVTNGGQAEAMRDVILGVLPLIQPIPAN